LTTDAKDLLRADRSALVAELTSAGAVFKGDGCTCPFHDDRNPSGSIYKGDDGAWRFKCHVPTCGFHGDIFDVKARASNRTVDDVLREHNEANQPKITLPREPKLKIKPPRVFPTRAALEAAACWNGDEPPLTIETAFKYTNPDSGLVDLEVFRLVKPDGDKTFKMSHPARGGWILGGPPKPWPAYNRKRIRAAETIIVVEGEKCVHALTAVLPDGAAATTSPAGARNAKHADWSPLAGKRIYIWPDADDDGHPGDP
jgi:hypothetical protein